MAETNFPGEIEVWFIVRFRPYLHLVWKGDFVKTISSLRRFRSLLAISALACPLIESSAQAVVIAVEDFESYAPGSALNGQSGGTGWTGAWTGVAASKVQSITLVDPNGLVSGGTKALQFTNTTGDIGNAFSRTFAPSTNTLYVAYQLRVESFEDNDFLSIGNSNGAVANSADTLSTGVRNNAGNPIYSRVGNSGSGDTDNVALATPGNPVPDATDFLIVAKYSKVSGSLTYNRTEVFVNPLNFIEPGTPSAVSTDSDPTISQLSLLTGRVLVDQTNDTVYLDSFRVATSFSEALGQPSVKLKNVTITAFADAHIQSGSNGNLNFANSAVMAVKNGNPTSGSGINVSRKAYIQFDVSNIDLDAIGQASLSLTVAPPVAGVDLGLTQWEFALYGVRDDFIPGAGKLDENWAENALNGNNAPANDTANGGAVIAGDVFGGTFLSTFILSGAGTDGMVIDLNDLAILNFLKSDTDGVVSFILVRTTQEFLSNSIVHGFYSSESTTGFGPRLNVAAIIVPEPSIAILGLMSLTGLALRRRHQA